MAEMNLSNKAGGMPVWVWAVGGTVLAAGTWFVIRSRRAAKADSTTQLAQNAAAVPTSSGGFSTDQAEAIFSDIRNLQGQETQFAGTASNLSNQISGIGQQISKIPSGPPGPPGPAGIAGSQGNPGPPGPPAPVRPGPSLREAQVHTDGKHSLQFYASQYGTSMANILAATARSESSDYNRPNSLLHKYVVRGKWSNEVPAGFTLFVPYYR